MVTLLTVITETLMNGFHSWQLATANRIVQGASGPMQQQGVMNGSHEFFLCLR